MVGHGLKRFVGVARCGPHPSEVYFWDVAHELPIDMTLPRVARLQQLVPPLKALLEGECCGWTTLANAAAAVFSATGWHWVGFYLVDEVKDNLVLGPFQGPVACTRLFRGKGVCASAWEQKKIQVVPDVQEFPGHVACSSASRSEVVLPVLNEDGKVVAVWDIDSAKVNDFTDAEVGALLDLTGLVSVKWNDWTWSI